MFEFGGFMLAGGGAPGRLLDLGGMARLVGDCSPS